MSEREKVILVLANLMSKAGELNEETAARVDLGYQVFKEEKNDYLFFIGWDYRPDSNLAISDAMKNYLETKQTDQECKVLINRMSRDSVGDAIFSRLDLDNKFSTYDLSVVSSNYHIPRLSHIFSRIYGNVKNINFYGAEIEADPKIKLAEEASLEAFDTTFEGVASGDLLGFTKRLIEKHPFYNGDVFPALKIE